MNIELILSPKLYPFRQLTDGHTTVAVDVLRATTAVCAAFTAGASAIVPLDSLEVLKSYRNEGYVIAAERNGRKVDGATCGNSPTEYLTMSLDGARLAYSTTNGTVTILQAADSKRLYVGAFSNLSALAQKIVDDATDNLVILCSGWKGDPSLEDTLFAGALIERLLSLCPSATPVNDTALGAVDLYRVARTSLYDYCAKATHVQRLQRMGCDADIRFALIADTCPVVPHYSADCGALIL